MKPRQIYYRRKKEYIIIEENIDGKTKYLKQLPRPEIMLEILKGLKNKPKLKRKQCKKCKKPFRLLNRELCLECYKQWRLKVENPDYQKIYRVEKIYKISYDKYKVITRKCEVCTETKAIHLHHKNFNKKDNSDDNLIGLCSKHHQLIHSEKDGKIVKEMLEKKGHQIVFFGGIKKYMNLQNQEKNQTRLRNSSKKGTKSSYNQDYANIEGNKKQDGQKEPPENKGTF